MPDTVDIASLVAQERQRQAAAPPKASIQDLVREEQIRQGKGGALDYANATSGAPPAEKPELGDVAGWERYFGNEPRVTEQVFADLIARGDEGLNEFKMKYPRQWEGLSQGLGALGEAGHAAVSMGANTGGAALGSVLGGGAPKPSEAEMERARGPLIPNPLDPILAPGQELYRKAFDFYYSPEHIERMFRRAKASGMKPIRLLNHVLQFYFIFKQEKVHPLQGGFFRRKIRTQRRSGLPRENPVIFYPRRVWEVAETHGKLIAYYWFLHRLRKKVEQDRTPYYDTALVMPEPEPAAGAGSRQPETAVAA